MLLNFLGTAGSLRRKSINQSLLRTASTHLPIGVEMDLAGLTDIPLCSADVTDKPALAVRMLEQIGRADAPVLACPEYNCSPAPALENILGWASREPNNALLADKPVVILDAGGGMDMLRAQYHLRQVYVYLDLHPLSKLEVFASAFASGFIADGDLADERIARLVTEQMQTLTNWTLEHKV